MTKTASAEAIGASAARAPVVGLRSPCGLRNASMTALDKLKDIIRAARIMRCDFEMEPLNAA
ncbi:hypothetical protein [Henriciella litoralis]|uniref:hypothetical protein n=1 Tax=Henriciella litoralis TaxID=568102 RepID=UPI0009FEF6A5|nr:hypothetical protein [Henriciella litoralis]